VGELPPAIVGALRLVFSAAPAPEALAKAYVGLALAATQQSPPAREIGEGLAEGGLRALCEASPQAVRQAVPTDPAPPELVWLEQACGPPDKTASPGRASKV
jgi:hypothetical protein